MYYRILTASLTVIAFALVSRRTVESVEHNSKPSTTNDQGYVHILELDQYQEFRVWKWPYMVMTNESLTGEHHPAPRTVRLSDGQRLVRLEYARGATVPVCDVTRDEVKVAEFRRVFAGSVDADVTSAITAEHLLTTIGGRLVEWTELATQLDARELLRDVQQNCHLPPGRRHRRSSLIVPGTKFCGAGNASADGQTLGDDVATDLCCNQHDRCAFTIEGFTYKYGLYNFRFHTISHCECDDVFRSCLRGVGSEDADIIGRLFFDVIGMKCFVFQRERECVERAWWGKCLQYRFTDNTYAELHGPLSY